VTSDNEVGYRRLVVWQKANELALQVYAATRSFPADELYGMTSQLRRAALSVSLNIAEGYGRQTRKELGQFLRIASGSLAEVECLLDFSHQLGYLSEASFHRLSVLRSDTGRLLWGLGRKLK
jgi:four helix bundle protein